MTNLRADILARNAPLPDDLLPLIDDADRAVAAMADEQDRTTKAELLSQVRQGTSNILVLRDGERPICFIAFRPDYKEASLRLGYITPGSAHKSKAVLELSIVVLRAAGFSTVATTFNWPQKETFAGAAEAVGFTRVERMNMVRRSDAGGLYSSLPEDYKIMPWSARRSAATALILFENAFPGDREFHKPYRTLDGCTAYLNAILSGRYGQFMPGLSFVACHGGNQVGQILAARLPRAGIDIVDLSVDREHRGLGIASSLIGSLIEANAAAFQEHIVLTVTRSNHTAYRLYRRLGFKVTDDVSYYIYDDVGTEGGPVPSAQN